MKDKEGIISLRRHRRRAARYHLVAMSSSWRTHNVSLNKELHFKDHDKTSTAGCNSFLKDRFIIWTFWLIQVGALIGLDVKRKPSTIVKLLGGSEAENSHTVESWSATGPLDVFLSTACSLILWDWFSTKRKNNVLNVLINGANGLLLSVEASSPYKRHIVLVWKSSTSSNDGIRVSLFF